MPKPGLRKTYKYSNEFKATAVQIGRLPDVLMQDVAEALDIHPFMLSRWRKESREGKIVEKTVEVDPETAAELKRLRRIERAYAILQEEHTDLQCHASDKISQRHATSPAAKPWRFADRRGE